jgi:hypothetical protein
MSINVIVNFVSIMVNQVLGHFLIIQRKNLSVLIKVISLKIPKQNKSYFSNNLYVIIPKKVIYKIN